MIEKTTYPMGNTLESSDAKFSCRESTCGECDVAGQNRACSSVKSESK